jgi:thiamine kinase-like enzyme
MSRRTLRSLPIWKHEIRIEALAGGLTNQNWKVTDGDAVYAAREGDDDPDLGISRRNEVACARLAAAHGIAPRIVCVEDGVMVSAFVEGAPLTPESARAPERIARVAQRLREVHALGAAVRGPLLYFSPFEVARSCLHTAAARGLELPTGDAAALAARVQELEARIGAFVPTFCHNDLMPGNLLDDGAALWLIDWEYAGIGHPGFDLAGFSNNCELDAAGDACLLAAYGEADSGAFAVYKAMAALRESLWAVVKGATSQIAFDYAAYRDENWARYERALAALG